MYATPAPCEVSPVPDAGCAESLTAAGGASVFAVVVPLSLEVPPQAVSKAESAMIPARCDRETK